MSINISALPAVTSIGTTDDIIVNSKLTGPPVSSRITWQLLKSQLAFQAQSSVLDDLSLTTPTVPGLGLLQVAIPPIFADYVIVMDGNGVVATLKYVDVASAISAQPLDSNLTTLANLGTFSVLALSLLQLQNQVTAGYPKCDVSPDQTITFIDPTNVVADLYANGGLATPRLTTGSNTTSVQTPTNVTDVFYIAALAASITIANPTGTFAAFQRFTTAITGNGSAWTIGWGDKFKGALPLTTAATVNTTLYCEFRYHKGLNQFHLITTVSVVG